MNSRKFIRQKTRSGKEKILARNVPHDGIPVAQEGGSSPRGFPPNNIVPLYHGGHPHTRAAVFHSALNSHYFAQRPDKNLRTMCYFGWKRQRNVQLGTGFHGLIHSKIETVRRDIARLALLRIQYPFRWDSDDNR